MSAVAGVGEVKSHSGISKPFASAGLLRMILKAMAVGLLGVLSVGSYNYYLKATEEVPFVPQSNLLHYSQMNKGDPFTVTRLPSSWDDYSVRHLANILNYQARQNPDSDLTRLFAAFSHSVGVLPGETKPGAPMNRLAVQEGYHAGFWKRKWPLVDLDGIPPTDLYRDALWGVDGWGRPFVTSVHSEYVNDQEVKCVTTVFPANRWSQKQLRACDSCRETSCVDVSWGDASEELQVKAPVKGLVWTPA